MRVERGEKMRKKIIAGNWKMNKNPKDTKEYFEKFNELVKECENYNKFPQDIFRECGIDPEIVGKARIRNVAYKWRKKINSTGEITDTRKTNSGNTLKRELSDKEKLERAEAKIKLLEAENELLKKNELIEIGILTDIKSISNLKQ